MNPKADKNTSSGLLLSLKISVTNAPPVPTINKWHNEANDKYASTSFSFISQSYHEATPLTKKIRPSFPYKK